MIGSYEIKQGDCLEVLRTMADQSVQCCVTSPPWPTKAHEYIFLLTKNARYFYDADAARETGSGLSGGASFGKQSRDVTGTMAQSRQYDRPDYATRNARTVWTITTQPYPDAHFATFPEALPERCIKAGASERGCCPACGIPWARVVEKIDTGKTQKMPDGMATYPGDHGTIHQAGREKGEGGKPVTSNTTVGWSPGCECGRSPIPCTVLDPFAGSGTTIGVACRLGRNAIGIELSPDYVRIARDRIGRMISPGTYRSDNPTAGDAPLFNY